MNYISTFLFFRQPVSKKKSSKKVDDDFVSNPLDSTLVHPESYDVAKKLIELEKFDVKDVGSTKFIDHFRRVQPSKFAKDFADQKLIEMIPQIVESFQLKLSFDIRDEKCRPTFRRDVLSIDNLHPGIVLSGFYLSSFFVCMSVRLSVCLS